MERPLVSSAEPGGNPAAQEGAVEREAPSARERESQRGCTEHGDELVSAFTDPESRGEVHEDQRHDHVDREQDAGQAGEEAEDQQDSCLLYTSPSPRDS